MRYFVGIDYGMNSPAICVYDTKSKEHSFRNCNFHFCVSVKKLEDTFAMRCKGEFRHKDVKGIDKYVFNANWVMSNIPSDSMIFIEGYSYGSKGKIFEIGENTGVLKSFLVQSDMKFEVVPPTTWKKHCIGKGNASKQDTFDHFFMETGVDLISAFGHKSLNNPVEDIVDSYYICKYGVDISK
jgi:hypothetical protein